MRIDDWHPVWGLSRVPSPIWNEIPAMIDAQMISEIVEDFGVAAANMSVAVVDGLHFYVERLDELAVRSSTLRTYWTVAPARKPSKMAVVASSSAGRVWAVASGASVVASSR